MLETESYDDSALDKQKKQANYVAFRKAFRRFGLPAPNLTIRIPGTSGKVTPLLNALRPFVYS